MTANWTCDIYDIYNDDIYKEDIINNVIYNYDCHRSMILHVSL